MYPGQVCARFRDDHTMKMFSDDKTIFLYSALLMRSPKILKDTYTGPGSMICLLILMHFLSQASVEK
jgi:hypothetical protein